MNIDIPWLSADKLAPRLAARGRGKTQTEIHLHADKATLTKTCFVARPEW